MNLFFKSDIYNILSKLYSHERIMENIEKLRQLEKPRGYSTFRNSTLWCKEILEREGLSDVRIIAHKADGKTASYDFIMPQAWDLCGRCTLSIVEPKNEMIADTDISTIFVSEYSAPTPEGGVTAEIVDFATLDPENPDCEGKYVFHRGYLPANHPRYHKIASAGCVGIVFAAFETTEHEPDSPTWTNGHGHIGWYHLKEDPVVPVFNITPKKGIELIQLMSKGKVVLHGEMNTKIYDGEIYTITATIPGKSDEEFALLGHLYEPFYSDDCQGFGVGVEIAVMLKKLIDDGVLPQPERTLRLIFSMERYGFAAFFANHDKKILAALSIDTLTSYAAEVMKTDLLVIQSTLSLPFFGDMLLDKAMNSFCSDVRWKFRYGNLSDDCWMGENTVDIPTNWFLTNTVGSSDYHHCDAPIFDDVQPEIIAKLVPMIAAYSSVMICGDKEHFKMLAAELEKTARYWLETKKNYIAGKVAKGEMLKTDAKWHIDAAEMYYMGRMASFNRFYPDMVTPVLPEHWADSFYDILPERELTPAEQAANNVRYRITSVGIPFCQVKVPAEERVSWPVTSELVWALLSPEKSVLDAIRLQDSEFGIKTSDETIEAYLEYLRFLEKYGYLEEIK